MKDVLNNAIKGKKIDEKLLFEEMANQLNKKEGVNATVIHGVGSKVEYDSQYLKVGKRVELGDLLFITFDRIKKEFRLCVLQAKFRKKRFLQFLTFNTNVFQLELLKLRPDIKNINKKNKFPTNILNFRKDYKSITAYGIFYFDNICHKIDFLYTIPENIQLKRSNVPITRNGYNRVAYFTCGVNKGSPNRCCKYGITKKEAMEICSIDVFEEALVDFKIGAPINDQYMKNWVLNYLAQSRGRTDNLAVIGEILKYYEGNMELNEEIVGEYKPSVFLVITEGGNK